MGLIPCYWPGCDFVAREHNSFGVNKTMRDHMKISHFGDYMDVIRRLNKAEKQLAEIAEAFSTPMTECENIDCECAGVAEQHGDSDGPVWSNYGGWVN